MNINFPPVDDGYIKTKVESGYYSNATEMVRDAVRRMREQDDHHGRLLAALEIGERDIAAGRTIPYTPDLVKQIEQEARTHAANNRLANPDVIPKRRLELSQQAKQDFRDILSYTLATWGESQLAKYRASINDALHVILHNPSAGRPSVKPTLKVLPVGHHRIFYRTIEGTIYVVRILHEHMDAFRHLD